MLRTMYKSKIHRATVTEANLGFVGSITIDEELMDKVDILPYERVSVVNNNNGYRMETYVIAGKRGKREIILNGAAARHAQIGDVIIIISYGQFTEDECKKHEPVAIYLNEKNEVVDK